MHWFGSLTGRRSRLCSSCLACIERIAGGGMGGSARLKARAEWRNCCARRQRRQGHTRQKVARRANPVERTRWRRAPTYRAHLSQEADPCCCLPRDPGQSDGTSHSSLKWSRSCKAEAKKEATKDSNTCPAALWHAELQRRKRRNRNSKKRTESKKKRMPRKDEKKLITQQPCIRCSHSRVRV